MHPANFESFRIALLGAGAFSCLFPTRWAPWCDVDLICHRIVQFIFSGTQGSDLVAKEVWAQSYRERVTLLKYGTWGLILVLLLPLHAISGSTSLVDQLWSVIDRSRHLMTALSPGLEHLFESHDWHLAEYELWEICVFFWVFPIIGRWVRDDYVTLATFAPSDIEIQLRTGQGLAIAVFTLSLTGLIFLVIVQVPTYRIIVELVTLVLLALADLYFFWRFLKNGKLDHAIHHLRVFMIIDLGALIAFSVLLLFVRLTDLAYQSHWSSAFVAGASAVNLMAANSAALAMRALHNYRQRREVHASKFPGRLSDD